MEIPETKFAISKKKHEPNQWDRRVMSFIDAYGNEIATIEFHIPGRIFPEEFRLKTVFNKQEINFPTQEDAERQFKKDWALETARERQRQENIEKLNNLLIIRSKKPSFNF